METTRFVSTEKLLIAGPCAAESREQLFALAQGLQGFRNLYFRAGIWKPRTRPSVFEGVGSVGLQWLKEVKDKFSFRVCTEVASPAHVEQCLDYGIDALWIGARTTTNPFSVQDIAEALQGTDVTVFVKNPLNPDLKLWIGAVERLQKSGCKNIAAIHRGFCLTDNGYYRQSPLWEIPIELKRLMPQISLLCDPSHISGKRDLVFDVSQTAMNLCFDGLMIETHPNPEQAKTDSQQQINLQELQMLIKALVIGTVESTQSLNELEILREKIDKTDTEIIRLLSERMSLVKQVSEIKKRGNMSVLQMGRWNKVLAERQQQAEQRGLNRAFIKEMFEQIHKESVSIQDNILKEEQNNKI